MKSFIVLIVAGMAFLVGTCSLVTGMDVFAEKMITAAVCGVIAIFPICVIIESVVRYREFEEKRKLRLAKLKEEQDKNRKRIEERRNASQWNEIQRQKKSAIIEVKYLGAGPTIKKKGGLGGALLGGFLGGPICAAVGAMLPKSEESLHRFAIKYGDGRVVIKDLHPNSAEYKKVIQLIKWEEI